MTDYKALEEVLEKIALGKLSEDDLGDIEQINVSTELDENDKKVGSHITSHKTKQMPNLMLIEKLLSERIGGPQDYC